MPNSTTTLRNGLKILQVLKQTSGLRLTEITQILQLNKTTVYRTLTTLVELNYLKKIDHRYSLVHQENNLATTVNSANIAIPLPKDISTKFKTTAFIGVLNHENVVITQVLPVNNGFDEFKVLGNSTPVNLSALGKAIAAFLSSHEQHTILQQLSFNSGTKYTLSDRLTFQKNLQIINQKGFALDDEESTLGIRCLAVPIFREQKVVAALGISGTFERLPRNKLHQMAQELIRCSQQITNEFF